MGRRGKDVKAVAAQNHPTTTPPRRRPLFGGCPKLHPATLLRVRRASRGLRWEWLLVALAVQLWEVMASDGGGDGDADAVTISLAPSRWANNLYPLSEDLAVIVRVNTGVSEWHGYYEMAMENKENDDASRFYSEPIQGTRFEDKVFWVTPLFPGLFHLKVVVTSPQTLDNTAWDSKTFSRRITFAVAAVDHRVEVDAAAAQRTPLAQCYARGAGGSACDVLLHKSFYGAPSVLTREELSLLAAFSPTWCGALNDAALRARFPQRVSLAAAPALGSCAFVEGDGAGLEGLWLGSAIDAHDTVIRVGAPHGEEAGGNDTRHQGSRTDIRFIDEFHLEALGTAQAAADENREGRGRVVLALTGDCHHAMKGPLATLRPGALSMLSPSFLHSAIWAAWADRDRPASVPWDGPAPDGPASGVGAGQGLRGEVSSLKGRARPSLDALVWATHECASISTFAAWHSHMTLPPAGLILPPEECPPGDISRFPKAGIELAGQSVPHRRLVEALHQAGALSVGGRQGGVCAQPAGGGARLPMLITGCGMSGTKFVAFLFAAAHFELGHENVGRHGMVSHFFAKGEQESLPGWSFSNFSFVAHIVRHPLKVVSSFLGISGDPKSPVGPQDDKRVPSAVAQMHPRLEEEGAPTMIRALDWWKVQNLRADFAASYRFRLEDIASPNSTIEMELCRRAGIPGCWKVDWPKVKRRLPSMSRNQHGGDKKIITWADLEAAAGECTVRIRDTCAAVVRDARAACRLFAYADC